MAKEDYKNIGDPNEPDDLVKGIVDGVDAYLDALQTAAPGSLFAELNRSIQSDIQEVSQKLALQEKLLQGTSYEDLKKMLAHEELKLHQAPERVHIQSYQQSYGILRDYSSLTEALSMPDDDLASFTNLNELRFGIHRDVPDFPAPKFTSAEIILAAALRKRKILMHESIDAAFKEDNLPLQILTQYQDLHKDPRVPFVTIWVADQRGEGILNQVNLGDILGHTPKLAALTKDQRFSNVGSVVRISEDSKIMTPQSLKLKAHIDALLWRGNKDPRKPKGTQRIII